MAGLQHGQERNRRREVFSVVNLDLKLPGGAHRWLSYGR